MCRWMAWHGQPVMIEEPGLPAEKRNVGNGFSDLPKAIAYFLAAAPKMAPSRHDAVRSCKTFRGERAVIARL